MRKLLLFVVIVLVAILCGWVTFRQSPGRASFTIETQKIKTDAKQALDEGKKALRKTTGESDSDASQTN